MRRTLDRHFRWLPSALTLALCLAAAWAISLAAPIPARDEFNVVRWELRHLPNKWLYLSGRFLRGGLSPSEEDERLGRYLVLTARIRRLEADVATDVPGQRDELESLLHERHSLQNDAEAVLEGRLTAVLEDAGLDSSLPLFPDARWVFPPVDVELEEPPSELAVSRRDRIELVDQRPLRPGLSLDDAVALERAAERGGDRSALVLGVSGVATYPSIVAPEADYQGLVEAVAHEWVHQYLAFKPLGRRILSSEQLRTLNETVADLAGHDLALLVVQRYPLPSGAAAQLATLAPPEPAVDVGAVLRRLRLDIEALLSRGRVGEAEALMEQRRRELADQGVVFRRINQAFFAFHGSYADDPASIDPLGAKVEALRRRAGSVGAFLRAAAGLTSPADLDELLARQR